MAAIRSGDRNLSAARANLTTYEHVMVGVNLALAADLHRRRGWRIVALAGMVAALPDWDGLSILFGPHAYSVAHRAWGHNLLVASLIGAVVGVVEYRFAIFRRIQQALSRVLKPPELAKQASHPGLLNPGSAWLWAGVGILACNSHLLADFFYSGGRESPWPLPLLWPFSSRSWALPLVPWGDLGATLIFVLEMFLLYWRPRQARLIACVALALVIAYVALRRPLLA
jgi:membrane-bound metal-dependent hydrolase YbcI (DUF457 family)